MARNVPMTAPDIRSDVTPVPGVEVESTIFGAGPGSRHRFKRIPELAQTREWLRNMPCARREQLTRNVIFDRISHP